MSRCTYVFLDESGNLDFGAGGSRYFVLTGVSLRRPSLAFKSLDDYKHHCLESGPDIEYQACSAERIGGLRADAKPWRRWAIQQIK